MIRQLRVKFMCINMTIVTVMLCVIFATVFHFTRANLERDSLRMMQAVALDPMRLGRLDEPPREVRLPYFTLQIGKNGELVAAGGGYYDLSDEEFLRELIREVEAADSQTGVLSDWRLRFFRAELPDVHCIVFADISSELSTMDNLVRNCLLIGFVSFLVFLLISCLLAKWAVKPVERAWLQQRQFVADASHELKTPLTVILTSAELLRAPDCEESFRLRLLEHILIMSRQMRELVESLLILARVDNGIPPKTFTRVDFSETVASALLPFEPLMFEKGLKLDCRIEKEISVLGSDSHLKRAVEILLDNAWKYGRAGSKVTVCLKKTKRRHCLFSVSSEGDPISQENLRNIFKRFYRIDEARGGEGFGLGLSIAEQTVREHGGKIWAQSEGGVNTFFILLSV